MISLLFRNLFFIALQPGLVAGLIPLWILDFKISSVFESNWSLQNYIGTLIFLIGLILLLWCIIDFAVKGQGTLSPADPTKKLVMTGLYHFSRNPMYVGVTLILLGEALFFNSLSLGGYLIIIFLAFNLFIIKKEEPRLRKDFGDEYIRYSQKVRRWI